MTINYLKTKKHMTLESLTPLPHTHNKKYDTPWEKALGETALKVKVTKFMSVCSKQVWGRLIGQGYYPEEHSSDWSPPARSERATGGRTEQPLPITPREEYKHRTIRTLLAAGTISTESSLRSTYGGSVIWL